MKTVQTNRWPSYWKNKPNDPLKVKQVCLLVNSFHPAQTDAEGNVIFEDDGITPVLNEEVTQHTFIFDSLNTVQEMEEEVNEEVKEEITRNKAKITTSADLNAIAKEIAAQVKAEMIVG